MLAESKSDNQLYAIKILKKESLIENDEVKRSKIEKGVLTKAREHDHPLEYCPGGNLGHHLQRGPFNIARSR